MKIQHVMMVIASAIFLTAGSVSAGGYGFQSGDTDSADATATGGGFAGTFGDGNIRSNAKVTADTDTAVNTDPERARASFGVTAQTGGHGFNYGSLTMDNVVSGEGAAKADASRKAAEASGEFNAGNISVGVGDKVTAHQHASGSTSGAARDSKRSDAAEASARANASQSVSAQSRGRGSNAASVDSVSNSSAKTKSKD